MGPGHGDVVRGQGGRSVPGGCHDRVARGGEAGMLAAGREPWVVDGTGVEGAAGGPVGGSGGGGGKVGGSGSYGRTGRGVGAWGPVCPCLHEPCGASWPGVGCGK